MGLPNEFPHHAGLKVCFITDNGYKEAGSRQGRQQPDGTARLLDPIRGPYFQTTQTQNNIKLKHPTQASIESDDAPPENGSMCMAFGTTGDPNMALAFAFDNMNNSQASAGNFSLTNLPAIVQAAMDQLGKIVSQGYQETTRDGAKVREPKDGQEWMHQLTNGLPIHAALTGLNGTVIPELKQIDTAIQQFGAGMSPAIISQMAGQLMSLSSLFGGMSSSQKNQIKENMPPEVANAFDSMIYLYQSPDDSTSDVLLDGRVDPQIFSNNAMTLLSQVRTLDDLVNVFNELSTNNTVRGVDALSKVSVQAETMHGTIYMTVDGEGNLELEGVDANSNVSLVTLSSVNYMDEANANVAISSTNSGGGGGGGGNQQIMQAIQKFASLLASAGQNTGATPQDNMWKDQAQKMAEIMGRVPNGAKWKAAAQKGAQNNSFLGPTGEIDIRKVGSTRLKWFG